MALLWALTLALVASCTNLPVATEDAKTPDVFDRIRALDLLPRSPQPVDQGGQIGGPRSKPVIYTGVVVPATDAAGARGQQAGADRAAEPAEGYELNFENTPIAMVAKAVLGDILGVGYAVDPRVQGTISLSSGKPVPKSDLVLRARKRPAHEQRRAGPGRRRLSHHTAGRRDRRRQPDSVAGHPEPGYGVSVLTLQYVSAAALVKLLDSFAIRPGMVRADPGRNILLIQGTGPERRNAMETALSFDVDWMRGQSVGIFPVQYSSPEPIIAEVEKILDSGDGGLSQGNIKFQVMARMNAILVVTKKPDLLRAAETWIKRLDTYRHQSHRRACLSGQFRRSQARSPRCSTIFSSAAARAVPSTRRARPRRAPPPSACRWAAAPPGGGAGGAAVAASARRRDRGRRTSGGAAAARRRFQSTIGTANSANANALEARGAARRRRGAAAGRSSKASASPPTPRATRC